MARGVVLKLEGFEALQKAFKELEPNLAKKVIRKSVRNGMKVVQQAAKDNAPVRTGAGKRGIKVRTSKGPRGSRVRNTIALAVLAGQATPGETWYMWLQEMGYHIGKRLRKGGKVIGYSPTQGRKAVIARAGLHFMRRAMRSKEPSVKARIIEDILLGIEREAGKP